MDFGDYRGYDLLQLAKTVVAKFGVTISAIGYKSVPIPDAQVNPSETAFGYLDRLCRAQGYLIYPDSDGNLILSRAGTAAYGKILVLGDSILAIDLEDNHEGRFGLYSLLASQDEKASSYNKSDSLIRQTRRKIVIADQDLSDAGAKAQIDWMVRRNVGDSQAVRIRVQGHSAPDGGVWKINHLIKIEAPQIEFSKILLIKSVKLSFGNGGSFTDLELQPQDAFTPDPVLAEKNLNDQ
jgi:prophage tail gpP-like protein